LLGLGVLAMPGGGQAQLWPLQTGPGGDMVSQSLADFDRLRRTAPAQPEPVALPARPGALTPAWTPPPLPPQRRIRRTAAPRPATAVAAAPAATPSAEPARKPDIETVERRLAERERILRDLQRDLAEERRLVEEWRGGQRASR
jgi:hypothetical protein